MKQALLMIAAVALVGCGENRNGETVSSGNGSGPSKKKNSTKSEPKKKPLPRGALFSDKKGRPVFSTLNINAAVEFFSGMHLDKIKELYGKPIVFKLTEIPRRSYFAGYQIKSDNPLNMYNPGTEKFSHVKIFHFDPDSLKCIAILAEEKFIVTPFGESIGVPK
jgi:hypothetical protein